MGWFSKKKEEPPKKIGDIIFFALLLFFLSLAIVLLTLLPVTFQNGSLSNLFYFILSILFGGCFAFLLIRAHLSVMLHEFKHMIVSVMAGNKARGMRIARNSGHFEYEYTKETASYNAFISLAPYYLPLATVVSIGAGFFLFRENHIQYLMLVGLGYGIDLVISIRDISPHQTDFSSLRGGFYVGLTYVISLHIIFAVLLITWVMNDLGGLLRLFEALMRLRG